MLESLSEKLERGCVQLLWERCEAMADEIRRQRGLLMEALELLRDHEACDVILPDGDRECSHCYSVEIDGEEHHGEACPLGGLIAKINAELRTE